MRAASKISRIPLSTPTVAKPRVGFRSCPGPGFNRLVSSSASMSAPIAKVTSVDHVVLTCADISATKEFYTKFLGMKAETFTADSDTSVVRHALSFGGQKINLHQHGAEFEPKAQNVQPGSADLCFIIETNVDEVLKGLQQARLEVLEGGKVVERTGAKGKLRSVYIRDPDLNLIELSNYV